ncbi:Crp/Fnr family transcriptional regulator [Paenibacillus sp. HN-1]|uniref:Crp/Fnr family transcriptional regulator n=1 Tax=Paenibacillus TaxID=44249 RepID=UPI001CAA04A7|nr:MULTISPECIES: Crp/Fnr family transcriptional regulator [Paenibacillus]MBY9081803.1 Crp/Fnr family transcriptional regulator [Paenibacillus sp. CGMCC 1.18879]MBY9086522.1 Crp/Fnr family transcriptional regulator [Paenibacillus sinensis]
MKNSWYDSLFHTMEALMSTTVPEAEKRNAMDIFKPVRLSKKEFFLKEGDIPHKLAYNVSGLLRCYYVDGKSNDVTKYFCFEGSVISYSALLLGQESHYYIEALEDCLLLCADYRSFQQMTSESLFWLQLIAKLQEQSLIYKEERESSFQLETASERYVHLLRRHPHIEERINLGHIASYLGISQVSLSRIRSKLKKLNKC